MASGKTTVGERLATVLDRPLRDCDDLLTARTGETAAALAERAGVDALHDLEAEVLLDGLADARPAVITAAASTIEYQACRDALGAHFVAWLRVAPAVLVTRVREKSHRPLDDDVAQQLGEQAQRRDPLFAAAADIVIDVATESPDDAAARIVARTASA
jgi:shikimate kinase